jgi:methyl-accepting chemotaxis protein
MNFDEAMVAHMRWKFRLADYIQGKSTEKLDPTVVGLDDRCDLGKWIHEQSDKACDADFKELQREHAAFHQTAASVLEAVAAKKAEDAKSLLDGLYSTTSSNVIMLIKRLREKAA